MYNLLLYDKYFNVKYLINYVDRELKNNIYNEEFKYIELEQELFSELSKKLLDNTIKILQEAINEEELTLNSFTLIPIQRPATATEALSKGLFENTLTVENLNLKVNALSKAIFELTISK